MKNLKTYKLFENHESQKELDDNLRFFIYAELSESLKISKTEWEDVIKIENYSVSVISDEDPGFGDSTEHIGRCLHQSHRKGTTELIYFRKR